MATFPPPAPLTSPGARAHIPRMPTDASTIANLLRARPGRPARDILQLRVIRELTSEDVAAPQLPAPQRVRPLGELKHAHHQLARLMAEETDHYTASAITGYSSSTIWRLQQDPMFQELVEHYREHIDGQHLEAHQRLAHTGMLALEEIQRRLLEEPDRHSNKDLRDIAELTFDRSIAPSKGAPRGMAPPGGAPQGVQLVVQFVEPKARADATVIDVTPVKDPV